MGKSDFLDHVPEDISNRRKTREEIVRAVTEGEPMPDGRTTILVIPQSSVADADIGETASALNVATGSRAYDLLQIYCEVKRATAIQAKVLMQRVEALSDEQINLLRLICGRENFRARDILKMVGIIRKFGSDRLLLIHAFVGLEGSTPGLVERLFASAMPQVTRDKEGNAAYEAELREKSMTRLQIDVFYNICTRLEGITPSTALAVLPKIRALKAQHAYMLNTFLKKESSFGNKAITNQNIPGLINLWLSLPELNDKKRFKKLVKKLSAQPEEKKGDFQFIVQVYKAETEREKGTAPGGIVAALKRILD